MGGTSAERRAAKGETRRDRAWYFRDVMAPLRSALLFLPQLLAACVPPPHTCTFEAECGDRAACVAGRCVTKGATAAIDTARRLLFAPVETAWLARHGGDDGPNPAIVTLGRAADAGAIALVRFAAELPAETKVIEAYILIERAADIDVDPQPITLYPELIVDPWDSTSLSWGRAPRVQDVGAARTRVSRSSGPLVRLEVRDLVKRWRRRGSREFGVAIVAEGESATGIALLWAPGGPRLELYVL
jgi:hypothetical protein